MTLIIELAPELEDRLRCESVRRGQPADLVAVHLLDEYLPRPIKRSEGVGILNQWSAQSAMMSDAENASNLAVLRAIDEDRLSDRRLFDSIPSTDQP